MPWKEQNAVSLKREFVEFASVDEANVRGLCKRFDISPTTAYKWMARFEQEGVDGLQDRSRRPKTSPRKTPDAVEGKLLRVRRKHRAWGGRKIRHYLLNQGACDVPAARAITEILRRYGKIDPQESGKHAPGKRFEQRAPNELWQMDFKGHFPMLGGRCHPLTVLDDHSRFALGLKACGNETRLTVQKHLVTIFRRYGLPDRILTDNGAPWGSAHSQTSYDTQLTVWLLRLGVRTSHGRPCHPQTQGKDERFHRTLKDELLAFETFRDLTHCQDRFDRWRATYNHERPHEALAHAVPASRYRPSLKPYPERLPPIKYPPGVAVRKVRPDGYISYGGRPYLVSSAYRGHPIALRPHNEIDGLLEVLFCHHVVGQIDLCENQRENNARKIKHTREENGKCAARSHY
jgi:transposase InsO family protein